MWHASSVILDELVRKFWGDSTYSDLLPLSPELAADMTSPSGLVGNMGVAAGPSIGRVWFGFILPLPIATGVVVLEAVVSVSACTAWAAPAIANKLVQPALSVRMEGENVGSSG